MRLNKKKLAAVMMSAVMAASVMPTTVFAVSGTTETVFVGTDGKVTVTAGDVTVLTGTADKVDKDATCDEAGYSYYAYDYKGETFYSTPFDYVDALGHVYTNGKVESVTETAATCTEKGSQKNTPVCDRCGEANGTPYYTDIAATGHKEVKETTYVASAATNTQLVNDDNTQIPELINDTADGKYTEVVTTKCSVCGDVIGTPVTTEKTLTATGTTIDNSQTKIVAGDNVDQATLDALGKTAAWYANKDNHTAILLKNCDKDATIYIRYYNKAGNYVSQDVITVAAHHTASTNIIYEAKEKADADLLNDPVVDKNGVVTITNKTCYKDVAYTETVVCANATHAKYVMSKTDKVAPAGAAHSVSKAGTDKVAEIKGNTTYYKDGVLTAKGYDELEKVAKVKANGIKLATTAACETEGTVKVTYTCTVSACGAETEKTETLKVAKLGHKYGKEENVVIVEPTCGEDGLAEAVKTCERCGDVQVVRTDVVIPATGKHSYVGKDGIDESGAYVYFAGDVVVDINGGLLAKEGKTVGTTVGNLVGYNVIVKPVLDCDTCGMNVLDKAVTVKITDIEKETKNSAGSITLSATFTITVDKKTQKVTDEYTVPYYSSLVAYLDRNPEAAKDGLTLDADGVWRYYEDGVFQEDYVGIVEFEGGEFFVANGVLCSEAEGLNQNIDGKWYFLSQGQIQRVDGFAEYDNAWFMLKNGELDLNANGLYGYNGGTFLFAAGKLRTDYSGLWQNPATQEWVFLANGQLQDQYTGIAKYDGHEFKLVNGKLVA